MNIQILLLIAVIVLLLVVLLLGLCLGYIRGKEDTCERCLASSRAPQAPSPAPAVESIESAVGAPPK